MNKNIMKALDDNLSVDDVLKTIVNEGDSELSPENVFETILDIWCGCGSYRDDNALLMRKAFNFCNGEWRDSLFFEYFEEEEAQTAELILFIFEKYDLVDHGTAIRCPWFTSKGELLYEAINKFDEVYEEEQKRLFSYDGELTEEEYESLMENLGKMLILKDWEK